MLISIIVPVYKVEAYIERFILSVIEQTSGSFELILVDDCSPDQSIALAEQMLCECVDIAYRVVKRPQNGGLSAARNSGIEVAKGDYLYFADSDDELELNAIANMQNAMTQYSGKAIYFFNATFKNPTDLSFQQWRNAGEIKRELSSNDFLTLLYTGKVGAYIWQFLLRKDLFKNTLFKEGAVWEDAIIVPRLVTTAAQVYSYDEYFVYKYWLREGSISQSVHPFLDAVVPALDEVEQVLYGKKDVEEDALYGQYIQFRTGIVMQLSRECFVRTNNYNRLMQIHHSWGKAIPSSNIRYLKHVGKKRSAIYLQMIKYSPSLLYFFYRMKFLK